MSSSNQPTATRDLLKMDPPTAFLSLTPTTSSSYPSSQNIKPATTARRSSSLSSVGSLRFLKLSPVHWGEHPDEHKEDYHEAVVEQEVLA
ncbi:hypothetical protein F4775DRAFT_591780 [Biscogniauxia sp. FL1348]|nr:hypothetical protein F4775DRAFT_591780 [Biscogniauxia sp. FL1348]